MMVVQKPTEENGGNTKAPRFSPGAALAIRIVLNACRLRDFVIDEAVIVTEIIDTMDADPPAR